MNSLSLYPTKESMFINLVNLSLAIIKDAFLHMGGNLGELPNQIRETVSIDMIRFLQEKAD